MKSGEVFKFNTNNLDRLERFNTYWYEKQYEPSYVIALSLHILGIDALNRGIITWTWPNGSMQTTAVSEIESVCIKQLEE